VSFDAEYAVPMETLFLPTGEGRFASHDLSTGRTVVARFGEHGHPDLSGSGGGAQITGAWLPSRDGIEPARGQRPPGVTRDPAGA
jgi:hypothetical protein